MMLNIKSMYLGFSPVRNNHHGQGCRANFWRFTSNQAKKKKKEKQPIGFATIEDTGINTNSRSYHCCDAAVLQVSNRPPPPPPPPPQQKKKEEKKTCSHLMAEAEIAAAAIRQFIAAAPPAQLHQVARGVDLNTEEKKSKEEETVLVLVMYILLWCRKNNNIVFCHRST